MNDIFKILGLKRKDERTKNMEIEEKSMFLKLKIDYPPIIHPHLSV